MTTRILYCLAVALLSAPCALAETWHVNNVAGNDTNDGRSGKAAFATIARAVKTAKTSDSIVLADTGTPYREAIRLAGLGGTPAEPFVIEGNGAVVTGLRPLPAEGWKEAGAGVWLYAIEKKPYGNPFLVHKGRRLAEAKSVGAIEPGEFFWDEKGIRFRPEAGKGMGDTALEATLLDCGVALGGASYVVCRNVVSEYHSNDGFNIHGDCRGVVFENIVGRHNGDDGFSIHECGGAVVRNGHFHHNRWGIQDVNASRSVFNGVTCEDNEANGADFVGGYHSLVDCVIRNNGGAQLNVRGEKPKHLVGGETDPLCEGVAFLQNVLIAGGPEGLRVGGTARVTARNCTIVRAGVGVVVRDNAFCHLTSSIIAECERLEADSASANFFRDHNLYHPGRFRWQGKDFGPERWDAFRAAAGHDGASLLAEPRLRRDGTWDVLDDSPARKAKPPIGPTAPVRGYSARPGAWSEAVNGLCIRLAAERDEVPVGATVVFELQFRFDPEDADPKVNILNRFLEERRVKLTFTDVKAGRAFERRPDDGWRGMPPSAWPRDFVELRGKPVEPRRLSVSLLTSEGEQLAPGAYSVALAYENDGKPELEFPDQPDGSLVQRPYSGPWKFWTGKLAAPPIRLTVVSADASEVEVKFHSALDIKTYADRIGYSWSEKAPQTLRLTRRPGYFLGMEYETHVFLDGKEVGKGGGGMASSMWLVGGESSLEPDIAKRVAAGASLRIHEDVTIFETSVPPGHMWNPKGGDYKVLWKGVVEGALPAGGKEGKQ